MFTREAAKQALRERTDLTLMPITYKKYNRVTHKMEIVNETLNIFTRKCIPAHESVPISQEQYDYMTSKESCPYYIKMAAWATMSKKQRLSIHFKEICHDRQGISFKYDLIE